MAKNPHPYYGNLQSYKFFIRPQALQFYKTTNDKNISEHQKIVQKILRIFALNGSMTTWNMAKHSFKINSDSIHTKDKEIRRLLLGRSDRGKYSKGMLELGLLVQEIKMYRNRPARNYRLSLHGILFCIDALELDDVEIDIMASKYSDVFPKVFGMWDSLKSIMGDNVYKIRLLSKGLLMDNPMFSETLVNPLFELMSFLAEVYRKNIDYIPEKDLAEQMSYWFYIYFLYSSRRKNHKQPNIKKLKRVLKETELEKWFFDFIIKAKDTHGKKQRNLDLFIDNLK